MTVSGIIKITAILRIACATVWAGGPATNSTYNVELQWDNLTDANRMGYNAYCSTNSFWQGTNMVLSPVLFSKFDVGTNTSAVFPGLSLGVMYHFVVTAYGYTNTFESDYSNEQTFRLTKPNAPVIRLLLKIQTAQNVIGPWDDQVEYAWEGEQACDPMFVRGLLTVVP